MTRLLAHPRRVFAALAIASALMLAFAVLYLQNVVGLEPCPMCIVQRYALIVSGVLCAIAACTRTPPAWRAWGVLAAAVTLGGAVTAARQSWLQWYPPEVATCGRDLYGMIESFPLQRVVPMIFKGSGDCSAVDWTLMGGSIANWSFVWFAAVTAALFVVLARLPRSGSVMPA